MSAKKISELPAGVYAGDSVIEIETSGDVSQKLTLAAVLAAVPASVTLPGSSTDNAVPRWSGADGDELQNSGVLIDDSNVVTGVASLTATTINSANLLLDGTTDNAVVLTGGNLFIHCDDDLLFERGAQVALRSSLAQLGCISSLGIGASSASSTDVGIDRAAAALLRVTDGSTGGGNLRAGSINALDGYVSIFESTADAHAATLTARSMLINTSGERFYFRSTGGIEWTASDASADVGQTGDVGLARRGTGWLQVTDGAGGFSDFQARRIMSRDASDDVKVDLYNSTLRMASDHVLAWWDGDNIEAGGAVDCGIRRSDVGVIEFADLSTSPESYAALNVSDIQIDANDAVIRRQAPGRVEVMDLSSSPESFADFECGTLHVTSIHSNDGDMTFYREGGGPYVRFGSARFSIVAELGLAASNASNPDIFVRRIDANTLRACDGSLVRQNLEMDEAHFEESGGNSVMVKAYPSASNTLGLYNAAGALMGELQTRYWKSTTDSWTSAGEAKIRSTGTAGVSLQGGANSDIIRCTYVSSEKRIGFYGVTEVAQAAHIADPSGGGTQDAEARTAINSILSALEGIGITASS